MPQADKEGALAKLIGSLKAELGKKNSTIIFKHGGTISRHVFPGWPELSRPTRGSPLKRQSITLALCASLVCSPVYAKTFVGVLWPMFGPTAAPGLVELVAELKMMPDVEIQTYLHQSWPSLVEDIDQLPSGTHTVVVGYSLGANSSVFVANQAKHVDLIIALQPSMLSWNPPVTGSVGRMIEIYNPNPWMTFGGMGSKKLSGPNIEYIANNDSHPGAQFSSEFRSLVKTEVAKFSAENGPTENALQTEVQCSSCDALY